MAKVLGFAPRLLREYYYCNHPDNSSYYDAGPNHNLSFLLSVAKIRIFFQSIKFSPIICKIKTFLTVSIPNSVWLLPGFAYTLLLAAAHAGGQAAPSSQTPQVRIQRWWMDSSDINMV